MQWKGTEVCLDLHCVCGYHGHLDDMFAYAVQCGGCDRVYEMPHTFHIPPGDGDPIRVAFGGENNLHVPTGEGVPAVQRVYAEGSAEAELDMARDELRTLRRKSEAIRALCDRAIEPWEHAEERLGEIRKVLDEVETE